MKKLLLVFFAIVIAVGCFEGCSARTGNESQSADTESNSASQEAQVSQTPPKSETQESISTSLPEASSEASNSLPVSELEAKAEESEQNPAAIPENAVSATVSVSGESFSVYLPEKWIANGERIIEGNRDVAIFSGTIAVDDVDTYFSGLDATHLEARKVTSLDVPGLVGKSYDYKVEIETGPFQGMALNETRYYVIVGGKIVSVIFYPANGIGGIGTQREEFESYIATLSKTE